MRKYGLVESLHILGTISLVLDFRGMGYQLPVNWHIEPEKHHVSWVNPWINDVYDCFQYLLVIQHGHWGWPSIVSFPIKNCNFHRFGSLPCLPKGHHHTAGVTSWSAPWSSSPCSACQVAWNPTRSQSLGWSLGIGWPTSGYNVGLQTIRVV